ncbi:hypothetical protein L2E82_31085 [Cichorium intybus]|uniref:Uncharacterized protein n=1 Tax=Cichorium intybus TaxID=13427 RepID=A0ACB9D2B9_CICIN|nr:hypothetical protein L2E82_31085 [Cichorium intybus]
MGNAPDMEEGLCETCSEPSSPVPLKSGFVTVGLQGVVCFILFPSLLHLSSSFFYLPPYTVTPKCVYYGCCFGDSRDSKFIPQAPPDGPQADGIITYLKKQVAPASIEIKTSQHVESLVDDIKSSINGIFPKFSGDKFDNFMVLAEKLRSDYDFGHTTNAELIPRGESSVTKPTLRLLKPFDELFLAFTESKVDAMENFIEEASTPLVTLFYQSPEYSVFLSKYFESEDAKVMFLVDYSHEEIENFRTIYHEVAALYKGKGLKFLMGNVPDSKGVFQAIPETNDEPVKVVVAKSLRDMVLDSKNNGDRVLQASEFNGMIPSRSRA